MPFTDAAWSKPGAELDAAAYCAVCLIDLNPKGKAKIKKLCKLPVRSRPGAPYNKSALRSAAGALLGARDGVKGVPANVRRQAARRLVRLMREAKMSVGPTILRLAGMK